MPAPRSTQADEPATGDKDWTTRSSAMPPQLSPSAMIPMHDYSPRQFYPESSSALNEHSLSWDWNEVGGPSACVLNNGFPTLPAPPFQRESSIGTNQYYLGNNAPFANNLPLNSSTSMEQSLVSDTMLDEHMRHGSSSIPLPSHNRGTSLSETAAFTDPPVDHATLSTTESRIERVLEVVSELQFENIDTLISTYYLSTFEDGSLAKFAQTASLARGSVARLAEAHYARELKRYPRMQQNDSITEFTRQLCSHHLAIKQLKRAKLYLREQVSWLKNIKRAVLTNQV